MRHLPALCTFALALFLLVAPADADFGLPGFDAAFAGAEGEALTQAAYHPDEICVESLSEGDPPTVRPLDPWRTFRWQSRRLAMTDPRRRWRENPPRPKAAAAAGGSR
jgi:hypothetical protein